MVCSESCSETGIVFLVVRVLGVLVERVLLLDVVVVFIGVLTVLVIGLKSTWKGFISPIVVISLAWLPLPNTNTGYPTIKSTRDSHSQL